MTYQEGIVYYGGTVTIESTTNDIDLSFLRNVDNTEERKAEILRKKLLRIRSLGK